MNNTKRSVENLLFAAWAASIIAMFGSLYFSEIKQYEPCALCWYQRIIMYPFTVISGIAIIRKIIGSVFIPGYRPLSVHSFPRTIT